MREPRPDRIMSPDDRAGWYAVPPGGHGAEDDNETWEGPSEGSLIRFMSEDGVDVPLWSEDGLIFVDGDELVREWSVSQELASDIVEWGRASQGPATARIDAEAARLIRLLQHELDYRFRIVYQP
ncbi:hypothetical protein [Nocardioides bruguierae]|uniref:hypothetical protein n=1 Tax=Nocardioides bruguierae TaxID=2945102 RepID=UPI00201FE8B9|nr:hypothetical protein [Nocardioides bruguierae]MCL8026026.1 hypothetical protein [Nocardioides bruguierae]